MNFLIIIFTIASYFFGAKAIYENKYYPNIYSRIIWLLLAINGLVSVILLKNNFSVILLAALGFLGSSLILILSLKKSKDIFGLVELITTIMLIITLIIWIFNKLPLLSLSIGLIITFIGGIPTIVKVIKNPKDEDILFWLFFGLASGITLLVTDRVTISAYLYPLFFTVFNGGMTLLCLRRYFKKGR